MQYTSKFCFETAAWVRRVSYLLGADIAECSYSSAPTSIVEEVSLNKLIREESAYLGLEFIQYLLQAKQFSVTSVHQDKTRKEKTVAELIRNLTKIVKLPLNVTVMSRSLQEHSAWR
jgi:hypothetical protein